MRCRTSAKFRSSRERRARSCSNAGKGPSGMVSNLCAHRSSLSRCGKNLNRFLMSVLPLATVPLNVRKVGMVQVACSGKVNNPTARTRKEHNPSGDICSGNAQMCAAGADIPSGRRVCPSSLKLSRRLAGSFSISATAVGEGSWLCTSRCLTRLMTACSGGRSCSLKPRICRSIEASPDRANRHSSHLAVRAPAPCSRVMLFQIEGASAAEFQACDIRRMLKQSRKSRCSNTLTSNSAGSLPMGALERAFH